MFPSVDTIIGEAVAPFVKVLIGTRILCTTVPLTESIWLKAKINCEALRRYIKSSPNMRQRPLC